MDVIQPSAGLVRQITIQERLQSGDRQSQRRPFDRQYAVTLPATKPIAWRSGCPSPPRAAARRPSSGFRAPSATNLALAKRRQRHQMFGIHRERHPMDRLELKTLVVRVDQLDQAWRADGS